MSLKYKSPLIRSRNTSAVSDGGGTPTSPSQNAESPARPADNSPAGAQFDNILVYDNKPQQPSPAAQNWRGRGFSSPRFNSPRPPSRGSPYQWTPPHNRHNSSYGSDPNNSGGNSMYEQNSRFSNRPQFNKHKYQNNQSNRSFENNDESYFHPSMLEDPWEQLLNNTS